MHRNKFNQRIQDLYIENFKTSLNEIKALNKWRGI